MTLNRDPRPVWQDRPPLPPEFAETGVFLRRRDSAPPTRFHVLGERSSGTNLLKTLLKRNTAMHPSEALGWKHGFPVSVGIPDNLTAICVFRNAADWAISLYKRPWHVHPDLQTLPFSDFIRAEWHAIIDRTTDFDLVHPELHVDGADLQYDRHPLTGKRFENIFALRRAKMAGHLGMLNRGGNVTIVRMETVIEAPEAFTFAFRTAYGLPPKGDVFRGETRRMGHGWRASVAARAPAPEALSRDDLAFLKSQIDPEIEGLLGYRY